MNNLYITRLIVFLIISISFDCILKAQNTTFIYENGKRISKVQANISEDKNIQGLSLIEVEGSQTYSITTSPNCSYNWKVVGGKIVSGQNTNSVSVKWLSSGTISVTETNLTTHDCPKTYNLKVSVKLAEEINNPLYADFKADTIFGYKPLIVNFTDQTNGEPTAYIWMFGDGGVSTEQNPSYAYKYSGNYTVSLTVLNADGSNNATKTNYIIVSEPLQSAFIADITTGEAPLGVKFIDQSQGNPLTWLWNFGDSTTSTKPSPVHVYEKAGTYTVSLQTTNAADTSIVIKEAYISINESLKADFIADTLSGGIPLTVNFSDTSKGTPIAWIWNFGDGNSSTDKNPQHIYTSPGSYKVELEVIDAEGNRNTESKVNYITATDPSAPLSANFISDVNNGVAPLTVQFTDISDGNPINWEWDFQNDGKVDSIVQNPTFTFDTAGTYTVSLIASDLSKSDTIKKIGYIVVTDSVDTEVVNFTSDINSGSPPLTVNFHNITQGDIIAYIWDFGDGQMSSDESPDHVYVNTGTYTVALTGITAEGEIKEIKEGYITVADNLNADFVINNTVPESPEMVTFSDVSTGNPNKWVWNFGDGNQSTEQNPIHTFAETGQYYVSLTIFNSNDDNSFVTKSIDVSDNEVQYTDINKEQVELFISCYPNPAKEKLFIKSEKAISSINLVDNVGRIVYESNSSITWNEVMEINTGQFQSGNYILNIKGENFEKSVGIVIEK